MPGVSMLLLHSYFLVIKSTRELCILFDNDVFAKLKGYGMVSILNLSNLIKVTMPSLVSRIWDSYGYYYIKLQKIVTWHWFFVFHPNPNKCPSQKLNLYPNHNLTDANKNKPVPTQMPKCNQRKTIFIKVTWLITWLKAVFRPNLSREAFLPYVILGPSESACKNTPIYTGLIQFGLIWRDQRRHFLKIFCSLI